MRPLHVSTFRIGDARRSGEGLRIGATRRPPRGVSKSRWQRDGYFDVWLPNVAPSAELLTRVGVKNVGDPTIRRRFFEAYRRELASPPASHAVSLLAAVARHTRIAIGCFCEDEARCHRSVLKAEIVKAAKEWKDA